MFAKMQLNHTRVIITLKLFKFNPNFEENHEPILSELKTFLNKSLSFVVSY